MKSSISLCLLLLAAAGLSVAEVPRKPVPSKYRSLWTDSPFTTDPVVTPGDTYNPLQDYVLLGVSPNEHGYRVTLMNRKTPTERPVIVESHRETKGFKIVEVLRDKDDPMGTRVKLTRGTNTGTVGFEEKFLTLKPAATPARQPDPTQQAGRPNPQTQQNSTTASQPRVPRRRIIPPNPPTPGTQNQPANTQR